MKKLFISLVIILLLMGCASVPKSPCEQGCDYEAYKIAGPTQNPFLYGDVYRRCLQMKCR